MAMHKLISLSRTQLADKLVIANRRSLNNFPEKYDSTSRERYWYQWWTKKELFGVHTARAENSNRDAFTMLLPPPNVTGRLHIGHALTVAIQDALVRWHRMCGNPTEWIPGLDHAGIATQSVVEKYLLSEGRSPTNMAKKDLFDEIVKWKEKYSNAIIQQLSIMGASLDWNQQVFTLDTNHVNAVTEAFVRLYEKKLIYRDVRFVNWSCNLKTAISDIEVDLEDVKHATEISVPGLKNSVTVGCMHIFLYPVEGAEYSIPIATTRIETMLGDVAVAVHPDDCRYKHLHGKFVINPFNQKRLPIICDEKLVDISKGTGAVKVTPAHDSNDFACGQRYNLPLVEIFNENGTLNKDCGCNRFINQHRFKVRRDIITMLQENGLYQDCIDHPSTIRRCSRSGDIIEPMLKPQWYIKCNDMAARALRFAKDGCLRIEPNKYLADWERWLKNSPDWCLSRQLYWGHAIPAWKLKIPDTDTSDKEMWVIARTEEEANVKASKVLQENGYHPNEFFKLEKDKDVLDTWFSSALLPLSVDGWPNERRLGRYPLSVMETGADILYFWVARMVMLCSELHEEGNVPFPIVYLHPVVRDSKGRKMSKSLGNVIDPLHVINGVTLENLQSALDSSNLPVKEIQRSKKQLGREYPDGIYPCGSDALRLTLLLYMKQGSGINLDINQLVANRKFSSKLWNAARFAGTLWANDFTPQDLNISSNLLSDIDQWMLSRLTVAVEDCKRGLERFEMDVYAEAVIRLVKNELCDVYIEFLKQTVNEADSQTSYWSKCVLHFILSNVLRLAHPIMPHITEELWQHIPGVQGLSESIVMAPFPTAESVKFTRNHEVEKNISHVLNVLKAVRYIRNEFELPWSVSFRLLISNCADETMTIALKEHNNILINLLKISGIDYIDSMQDKGMYVSYPIDGSCTLYADVRCHVNIDKLRNRQQERLTLLSKKINKLQEKFLNVQYCTYAPDEVKMQEKATYNILINRLDNAQKILAQLDALNLSIE